MATVNLYQPYQQLDTNPWYGEASGTGSKITISDGYHTETFTGSFSYSDDGEVTGGTLSGYSYSQGGSAFVTISGASVSSVTAYNYYMNSNIPGLVGLILSKNDTVNGSKYDDKFSGYGGNDRLYGNAGNDLLSGDAGDDLLDGGLGADSLDGGLGNDTYYLDNAGDLVIESSATGGIDTLISSVSRTLGANQENLTLSGAAAINGSGNELANKLIGNSGNNVLNGKAGADTMVGGLGNDTYYVDNASDVVTEASTGGIDTVIASVTRILGIGQENLTLSGTAAINGSGNELVNKLIGNSANNVLDGKAGADTMEGGLGNDTYYVDNASDVVTEASSGGIDTVIASVTRTLGIGQENLTLSGIAAINGSGNELVNKLTGNSANNLLDGGAANDTLSGGAGNDRLIGGAGKDVLTGGTGNDVFDFNSLSETGLTSTTWDVIADFVRGADKIDLSTLDANTAITGNGAFTTVIGSSNAFTAAGQLRVTDGVLYGNTDADATAEFAIELIGITSLSMADFIA